jgi:hypothetical protein
MKKKIYGKKKSLAAEGVCQIVDFTPKSTIYNIQAIYG